MNILILAAEFQLKGNSTPFYLSESQGKMLIQYLISSIKPIENRKVFVCVADHDRQNFHLDRVLNLIDPGIKVIPIYNSTKGSGSTALYCACQFEQNVELLIMSANELVDTDLTDIIGNFRAQKLDAGTIIFNSINPRYSYVHLSEDNLVVETSQRNPISSFATTGTFWFRKTSFFVESAKKMIQKNNCIDGSFFIAPTFNEMILNSKKVGVSKIEEKKYIPLKNKNEISKFERDKN